jgi:capsular polysaccharide biosynthesis protein
MQDRRSEHVTHVQGLIQRFRGDPSTPEATPSPPLPDLQSRVLEFRLFPQHGLLHIDACELLSGEWQVIKGEQVFMDPYVVQPVPPRSAYLVQSNHTHGVFLLEAVRGEVVRDAYLLGGGTNYAHWVLDSLPRLQFLGAVPASTKIIINTHRAAFQDESLAILGVDASRLMQLAYPGVYRCERLLCPSTGSGSGTSPLVLQPQVVQWLRGVLLSKVTPAKATRRLFVSRMNEGPGKMRLTNHKTVIEAVSRLGFEVVTLAGMPLLEQVKLFAEAKVVVGPHGAAFANMAFAPAGATLVELMGPTVARTYGPHQFFARLCAVAGQRYGRIIGEAGDAGVIDPLHVSTEQYRVEPGALLRQLAKFLA